MSSSNDERPPLITTPTELERQDAYRDIFVLLFSLLFGWYAIEGGVPLAPVIVAWVLLAGWALTSPAASDIGYGVGSLAGALRSRLGERRAHEWLLALGHYWRVAVYPVWRAWCLQQLKSSRQQMSRWQIRVIDSTMSIRSPASSWASSIALRWSARRGK